MPWGALERPRGPPAESRSGAFAFERSQRFVIHIPALQDGEDRLAAEAGARQLAENACCLFLILWFRHPLPAQELASLSFFRHAGECGFDRLVDDVAMHAPGFQIGNDTQAAKLLIIAAQPGKICGVLPVVQIAVVLEAADDELDQRLAVFRIGFHPETKQALEFRDGTHAARQGSDRIGVEFVLGIELFLRSRKWHSKTILVAMATERLSGWPCPPQTFST